MKAQSASVGSLGWATTLGLVGKETVHIKARTQGGNECSLQDILKSTN